MRIPKFGLIAPGALAVALAAPAFAQTTVTTTTTDTTPVVTHTEDRSGEGAAVGGLTGAAAGAVVGGPVGAAVGFVGGALLGDAANVPEPVVGYVETNRTRSVTYDGDVAVGTVLPETVELTPVPDSDYRYVDLNGAPVIVEPQSRTIVRVVQ
jgi:hypothetical protein